MSDYNRQSMWDSIIDEYQSKSPKALAESDGDSFTIPVDVKCPKDIVREMDKYVIGQTGAKQLLAIAIYNRIVALKNKALQRTGEDYAFEKNNILMIGDTGSGKTHMLKALSKIVYLPLTIQDATSFTSAGYVGRDIHECVQDLLVQAASIIDKIYVNQPITVRARRAAAKAIAEYGIIYIDEADKIRLTENRGNKDISGGALQDAFLKFIEGTEVNAKSDVYSGPIDTTNMLFVFGGSFSDLRKIISRRSEVNGIGFTSAWKSKEQSENLVRSVVPKDLIEFGLIPELLGRLSTIVVLDQVDKDMIYKILTQPKGCVLSQITAEFKSFGHNISFTEDAIEYIVERAIALKLGARGLRSVCQSVLRTLYYSLPSAVISKRIIITKDLLLDIEKGSV